jgi:ABC-type Fe3+-siderophore transport system permease subunit
MNTRIRQILAPSVLGLLFLASLVSLSLIGWDKSIACVVVATVLSVVVTYWIWPSSPITLALTMILVSVVLPVSAMYIVANYGESEAPFWLIFNMVNWRRIFLPTVSAAVTALCLRFLTRWHRLPSRGSGSFDKCPGEETM